MQRKGLVQIYTGEGKGKTTAAIGLAVRASGAGLKVFILQFIKNGDYSEIKILKKIKNITIKQCGRGCFIRTKARAIDVRCAKNGIAMAGRSALSGKYDIIILDEINIAIKLGLVDIKEVINIIKNRCSSCEIVLTGRHCPTELFKYADLITDMREIKHPFAKGVKSRLGIEH